MARRIDSASHSTPLHSSSSVHPVARNLFFLTRCITAKFSFKYLIVSVLSCVADNKLSFSFGLPLLNWIGHMSGPSRWRAVSGDGALSFLAFPVHDMKSGQRKVMANSLRTEALDGYFLERNIFIFELHGWSSNYAWPLVIEQPAQEARVNRS
ncbi:hypothetical protein [Lysobacter gummosus]|uniref:hypothetical protein n=1 Tax=Lysobacter gummosus TaxID=262324 RepID=UPI003636DB36